MTGKVSKLKTPDDVETIFYGAFRHCDVDVMASLWAEGDVVCVHPGSGVIVGHDAVVRSWSHIFLGSSPPQIKFTPGKRVLSGDLAVHVGTEEITTAGETAVVLTTNVYQKIGGGWFMIEHHASLVHAQPQQQTLQ